MKHPARRISLPAVTFLAALCLCTAQAASMPKVGEKAPLVQGKEQNGQTWKLDDQIGKHIVLLYFYPKDETPGCTKEACGFRDRIGELKKQNVEVIGVSFDTEKSHRHFIARYHLNFPLIADPQGKIADVYGVRMQGRNMDHRVSFLIGLDGRIAHVTVSPNAEVQLRQMTAAVKKLKS